MAADRSVTPSPASPLVDRFRCGDRAAFLEIYAAHAGDLRGLVGRFFSSPFEREEATQEVWLHAHRMSTRYDPDRGALLTWLRALAINRCREILRARGRRLESDIDVDDDANMAMASPSAGADPDQAIQQHRLQHAVQLFVATLSAEEAAVFRHSMLEDRPHEEVAAMIGIRVRRCKYLRKKLLSRAAADPGLTAAIAELRGGQTP